MCRPSREDLSRILAAKIAEAVEEEPEALLGPTASAVEALLREQRASLLDSFRREMAQAAASVEARTQSEDQESGDLSQAEAATIREMVDPVLRAVAGEIPPTSPDLDPRRRGLLREGIVLGFAEGVRHAGGIARIELNEYPSDSGVVERVLRAASSFDDIYPGLAALPQATVLTGR